MRRWPLLLALLAGLVALVLLFRRSVPAAASKPAAAEPTVLEDKKQENALAPEVAATLPADDSREELGASTAGSAHNRYSGRVVGPEGEGVSGARVRWVALEAEDLEATVAWPGGGYGEVGRRAVEVVSGEGGRFTFAQAPAAELALGSALVVTHGEFGAGGRDLVAGADWPRGLEVRFEGGARIGVRVVGADGEGVAGARVRQVGFVDHAQGTPSWLRHLEASGESGADGRVVLAGFPRGQALWAEHAGSRSRAWEGRGPGEVVLTLGETCTLGGALELPEFSDWDPQYRGERRVVVSGLVDDHWRSLGVVRDVAGSEWGPIVLPIANVTRLCARLEGIPYIPVEHELEVPPPGASARVDFQTRVGQGLWLAVTDPEGRPVLDATATAWWGGRSQVDERRRAVSSSRPDGTIYVGTFPAYPVEYRVQAPGFADQDGRVGVFENYTYEVVLQPSVPVTGRCLFRGEPVQNFELLSAASNALGRKRTTFLERVDGRFELDGLAPGGWTIQAISPGLPASPETTVTLRAGEREEVVLELSEPVRGTGRVVAAESGKGLATATVQVLVASGVTARGRQWEPVRVAADGSFDLLAFNAGRNFLRVAAPGFATLEVETRGEGTSELDWGEIRLHKPQGLTLRAVGGESLGFGLQELRVHDTAGELEQRGFDADGVAYFASVPPGPRLLIVQYPNLSWTRLHLDLQPGREWDFELEVAGGTRLDVLVTDAEGKETDFAPSLLVDLEEDGLRVLRGVGQEGMTPARVEGLRASSATVYVLRDSEIVATRRVELAPGATTLAEIRLGEGALRARVVDGERAPVAGAWVVLRDPATGERVSARDTDTDGWANLLGVPERALVADVLHASGERYGVALDGGQREHELVLAPEGSIELVFRDGELALEGVETRLETVRGTPLKDVRASDARGVARYEALGAGQYRFGCARVDCWPVSVERALGEGEEARMEVELRRLGELEIKLWSASGGTAGGVELALVCLDLDLDGDVGEWLRAGRIEAPDGLTTKADGTLSLRGLPHGRYAWRVGEEAGEVTLEPGANELELRLVGAGD